MRIIAKVGAAFQRLFGIISIEANEKTGVIQRVRKFDPASLAKTFLLGFLKKPDAKDEDLALIAAQCGADVTPQAIDQRHTPAMADFLETIFREGIKEIVGSDQALAPILERFPSVPMLDGTTITLPDSMEKRFPGCGGSYEGGAAALKLQVEIDLRSGALSHIEIEPGRSPDAATIRQQARRGAGSLRITDLGYFNVPVFAEMMAAGEHFLSRLQYGTRLIPTSH